MGHISPGRKNKFSITGNPIRSRGIVPDRAAALKSFGLDAAKLTVLVMGGSQGAHVLNESFVRSIALMERSFRAGLQIIHLTGVKDYEWAVAEYCKMGAGEDMATRVHSFIDRIDDAYSAADLVVTRAGASALFEVAYFEKAMIVVPYPYAMSHQLENARAFSSRGGAIVIEEKDLQGAFFKDTLEGLLRDRAKLKALGVAAKSFSSSHASDRLADMITGGL